MKTHRTIKLILIVIVIVFGLFFYAIASIEFPILSYRVWANDDLRGLYFKCKKIDNGDSFDKVNESFIELGASGNKPRNQNENIGLIAYSLPNWPADICFVRYKMKDNIYLTVESSKYSPD